MSDKPRIVPVIVTDPSTKKLVETDGITYGKEHRVPEDDRLSADLIAAIHACDDMRRYGVADRLRVRFGLDAGHGGRP